MELGPFEFAMVPRVGERVSLAHYWLPAQDSAAITNRTGRPPSEDVHYFIVHGVAHFIEDDHEVVLTVIPEYGL